MKEKFDRNSMRVNIGEIGKESNETTEEKMARLDLAKKKIQGATIDKNVKEIFISNIDEMIDDLRQQNSLHR